jgi:hypothetical protein
MPDPTHLDRVLPKVAREELSDFLPPDPSSLLSEDQRKDLDDALARLARQRRDAETTSGSLRLA